MIDWKNPEKEFPDEGRCIAVITYHNKNNWPLSAEILFGIVEYWINRDGVKGFDCQTWDCTGYGCSYTTYPEQQGELIHAWAYCQEINKPSWMTHDPHFDMHKSAKDIEKTTKTENKR